MLFEQTSEPTDVTVNPVYSRALNNLWERPRFRAL